MSAGEDGKNVPFYGMSVNLFIHIRFRGDKSGSRNQAAMGEGCSALRAIAIQTVGRRQWPG